MAGRSITDNLKEGAAARQAHYRWAAIPAEILKRWTAERGRRTKTSRKWVAGRRALHYRWFGSLGMSAYLGRSLCKQSVSSLPRRLWNASLFDNDALGFHVPPDPAYRLAQRGVRAQANAGA